MSAKIYTVNITENTVEVVDNLISNRSEIDAANPIHIENMIFTLALKKIGSGTGTTTITVDLDSNTPFVIE